MYNLRVGTARQGSVQLPPVVFQLAGHPLRWRLLRELAWSDRRVRELMVLLDEPQSLVSYHLRRLRAADLISVRRSSFDGRDSYYSLNLGRCGELLAAAGAALHPALRRSPRLGIQPRRRSRRVRVLFLCTGNSARSQIAEGLLQDLSGGAVEAFSAGSRPKRLHPNAVRVMHVRGIDISHRRAKHLNTLSRRRFDYVISLCDRVREVCPQFPGDPQTIHWSILDPAAEPGSDADTYPAFEHTAADLETRTRFLLDRINNDVPDKEVSRS
jgi:ArsR family transcriptional regulator, arsenate/arsenite/antimonite-responsive transcriptional repressor / arsenate reductase (thioredoxin)